MKVRKFKIVIAESQDQAIEGFKKRFTQTWKAAEAGVLIKGEHDLVITIPNVSSLTKIFSPERIRILRVVRDEKPESIYKLAKLLGRSENNVRKDVQELAAYGIIHLKRMRKKGQKQESLHPEYNWDGFDIAV